MKSKKPKITVQQERFIEEYVRTGNATHSARVADYAHPGIRGHELARGKTSPQVRDEIRRRLENREEQANREHEIMRTALLSVITMDPRRLQTEDGEWLPLAALDLEDAQAVQSLKESTYRNESDAGVQEGVTRSYKLMSRLDAIKTLGRTNGFFTAPEVDGADAPFREAAKSVAGLLDSLQRRLSE